MLLGCGGCQPSLMIAGLERSHFGIGAFFFIVALIFVYRSFYAMRIPKEQLVAEASHDGICRPDLIVEPQNLTTLPRFAIPTSARRNESIQKPTSISTLS
jgi:hypothetical protein